MELVPRVDSAEWDARAGSRVGAGDLTFGVHQPGETGGCDSERQCRPGSPRTFAAGVHLRDVSQDRWVKLDVAERLSGPGQRQFLFGGAVGVVERGFRGAALGDSPQILDRQRGIEPPLG